MRVLLIEDDAAFGAALRDGLVQDGCTVDWLSDGRDVEPALRSRRYDGVLLDLGLPGRSGEDCLKSMRARRDPTPVIVITARGQMHDRIALLDHGADDYLSKPVDLGELGARLRAVVRRGAAGGDAHTALEHGPLRLDPVRRILTCRAQVVPLRARELWLLEVFMREPARTFTRTQLEEALYGAGDEIESNAVEVYVHHLRRKIAADVILTVRGLGYRMGPVQGHG